MREIYFVGLIEREDVSAKEGSIGTSGFVKRIVIPAVGGSVRKINGLKPNSGGDSADVEQVISLIKMSPN